MAIINSYIGAKESQLSIQHRGIYDLKAQYSMSGGNEEKSLPALKPG